MGSAAMQRLLVEHIAALGRAHLLYGLHLPSRLSCPLRRLILQYPSCFVVQLVMVQGHSDLCLVASGPSPGRATDVGLRPLCFCVRTSGPQNREPADVVCADHGLQGEGTEQAYQGPGGSGPPW